MTTLLLFIGFIATSIGLITAIILWIHQLNKTKILSGELSNLSSKITSLKTALSQKQTELQQITEAMVAFKKRNENLEEQNKQLSKYRVVLDADKRASEILGEANRTAKDVLVKAENQANALRSSATAELEKSNTSAKEIIENANKRAEEIAGEAFAALKKADNLEKTAQAMKNVIDGYGDRYLIPSYSLLDELADEFGHVEAGQELKKIRGQMRLMIKNGTAATCDYVENHRRETAIEFVLDAFNGKVDTILANLKHDNHGTMGQKIKDASFLVNNNGKAFRNAVITEEYLQIRLKELQWAATVQELKWKEREEQRLIKEQIREEEKAQREYEKAMKDAQKEEEMLKRAIEKAQKEVGQATEEQKAKYEAQLQELNERFKAAEERNQRAISMAQQTKIGHVYIISNIGSFGEHVYKIGLTRRLEPLERIRELGDSSVPFEFDVHALIPHEDAPYFERELHKRFVQMQVNKVNPRKEFFKITLKEIREEIEKLGINPKWTMTAEARDYRESLAVEKGLSNHTINQEAWIKNQMEIIPLEPERDIQST